LGTTNQMDIENDAGVLIYREHVLAQIERVQKFAEILPISSNERIIKLYPLYISILNDLKSMVLLLNEKLVNQSYIICRALLERSINYCYLLFASEDEYTSYVDYCANKAGRSLSKKAEVNGKVYFTLEHSAKNDVSPKTQAAIDKFTSDKGREIPRWTNLNIDKRAEFLLNKTKISLFPHLTMVYSDASEATHGTLYGAMFHYGFFQPNLNVGKNKDTESHTNTTTASLYLICGSAVNTIFSSLIKSGEKSGTAFYSAGKKSFESAAEKTGLMAETSKI
jgi:hypothetical protein